jgi:nucleotide-binding universal stress UspA family protein
MSQRNTTHRRDTEKISSNSQWFLHQNGMLWERANLPQELGAEAAPAGRIRRLMVPLDGTPRAEHALPYALAIARRSDAALRLVHVHSRLDHAEAWDMYPSYEALDRRKQEKQKYLRELADRITRLHAVSVETILVESFDTEESLVKTAADADLVVAASRRRGFWQRLLSYSVSNELRRRLRIPLLLVRGYEAPADLTGDPIARHILVSLDGSASAERILEPVQKLGRLEDTAVTLLNVQDEDWTRGAFEHDTPSGYLVGKARTVREALPVVDAQVMTTDDDVAAALADMARRRHVDLIALATSADGGWRRWMRGSVLDSLLARTDLPILTGAVEAAKPRPEVVTVGE